MISPSAQYEPNPQIMVMYKLIRSFRSALTAIVQTKYFLPICFIAAFVIRMGWVYLVDAQPVSDFRWYYERGMDFAAGRGYSVGPAAYWPENLPPAALVAEGDYPISGRPTAYWPVGYPAFLGLLFALFGPSLLIAKIANVILYLGILFLAYSVAKSLFNSELTGRMTLLILSFYPNHIAYSSLLATESLFLFLLLLGIALLVVPKQRFWLALASGVVFGLACLVKPQSIFVPAVVFAASLAASIKRKVLLKHFIFIVIVYIALGLTVLPWTIRNYNVFNDFAFISNNGGINLLVGNNPYATGAYGHYRQMTSMLSDVKDEHARNVKARTTAVEYMLKHPWETIKLWPRKLWYLYRKDAEGISWNESGISLMEGDRIKVTMFMLKAIAQCYYVIIGTAFLYSIFILFREHRNKTGNQPLPTLGLWIVLYFTFISLLTFGDSRFHFPMIPWIVMYVGAMAEVLIRPVQQVMAVAGSTARGFTWN